ncbi:DUF115 domain-containing protein [Candidatus Thorarchaeota archaeon]|nr:MAG: DUF115 domain-containing protein [Candidatus Thorarchaeota archaeon]
MIEWSQWRPTYDRIARRLGLDPEEDRKATHLLTRLLRDTDPDVLLDRLQGIVRGQRVIVCGAGPSLERDLLQIRRDPNLREAVLVAADGAADGMLEFDMKPDLIVTDLDGDRGALQRSVQSSTLAIIHAHGDNTTRLEETVPTLPPVLGSTQVEPTDRAFLWGGFTDGDRACYVVADYEPSSVILAGMDFGDYVGKWSKPEGVDVHPATELKREKLRIGRDLLQQLIASTDISFTEL